MNNISHIEIGPGSDVCPSCKSDSWKSAKMVIMEGTTNTKGTIDGNITDPGAFTGGLRNFLLSDKWFSWDYPIEAEIGLTSNTELVEEVRRLMIEHSAIAHMPIPPAEPKKIGVFKKGWNAPSPPNTPKCPDKPKEPEEPEKPDLSIKSMFLMFITNVFGMLLFLLVINAIFRNVTLLIISVLIFFASAIYNVFYCFSRKLQNKEYKEKYLAYEEKMKEWPAKLDNYKRLMVLYEKDMNAQREELKKHKRDSEEYYESINEKEKQEMAAYQRRLSEYKAMKNNVIKARKLLWERTRVCTRCGKVYLGNDVVHERIINDALVVNNKIITDDTTKRIFAALEKNKIDGLYVGDDIPEMKLRNAKYSFPVDENIKVLGIIDATILGSCNVGLAITDQGLVWKNGWSLPTEKTYLSWGELLERKDSIEATKTGVVFGDGIEFGMAGSSMEPADALELFVSIADEYALKKDSTPGVSAEKKGKSAVAPPARDPLPDNDFLPQNITEDESAIYQRTLIASFALMVAADGEVDADEVELVSAFFDEEEAILDKALSHSEFKRHIDKLTSSHVKSKAIFNLQTEKLLATVRKLEDKDLISRLEVMLEGLVSAAGGLENEATVEMMRKIISNTET